MTNHTADGFIQELKQHQNEAEIEKMKSFLKVQMKTRSA